MLDAGNQPVPGTGEQITSIERYRRTLLFQEAFLDNICRNGRLAELELVGRFKARAFVGDFSLRQLFKDVLLAPRLMWRGKLHFFSRKTKDRELVGRIFARCAVSPP